MSETKFLKEIKHKRRKAIENADAVESERFLKEPKDNTPIILITFILVIIGCIIAVSFLMQVGRPIIIEETPVIIERTIIYNNTQTTHEQITNNIETINEIPVGNITKGTTDYMDYIINKEVK